MASRKPDDDMGKALEVVTDIIQAEVVSVDTGLGDKIRAGMTTEAPDTSGVYSRIVADILSATTADDVLDIQKPLGLGDVSDVVLEISNVKFLDSDMAGGAGYYAFIEATRVDTDEEVAVTTGQQAVLAQLFRLDQLRAFPCTVKVIPSRKPNKYGKTMYRLGKADA